MYNRLGLLRFGIQEHYWATVSWNGMWRERGLQEMHESIRPPKDKKIPNFLHTTVFSICFPWALAGGLATQVKIVQSFDHVTAAAVLII